MTRGFCHLNLHTDRSQFVGMIKPSEIVDWCKRHGLSAAAITDHDNMCAAVELYKHCKAHNIKPVYGTEVSVCPDKTRRERGAKNLVLLAKNFTGFKNLVTLSTIGGMYFYYRPRIDMNDLCEYSDGLIALTACLNGLTAHRFFVEGKDGLYQCMTELHEIFWENLYLEVQPTAKDPQRVYNEACGQLAQEYDWINLVATGDPHYLNKEDREFHEHFMRIRAVTNKGMEWKYPFVGDYHVRTYDEMVDAFSDLHGYDVTMLPVFKTALDRPQEIVDGIECFDIKEGVRIPTLSV